MPATVPAILAEASRPFTTDGATLGAIAGRAAGIRQALAGSPADEPVALCVEGRAGLLACLLAGLAGGPPLLLPHACEPRALAELRTLRPFRRILADGPLAAPEGTAVLNLADLPPAPGPVTPLRPADTPFLWLFTGGSTGTPRLWAKTPANLFGEAHHLATLFAVGPADRIVATVPPRHIYGLLASLLLPFVAGARVVDATCAWPGEIATSLAQGATVLVSVPAHYGTLHQAGLRPGALRLALSSAAPLPPGDAATFREAAGVAVTEIYGSTETGGMATRRSDGRGPWTPFAGLDWRIEGERLLVRSPFLSPDLPRDPDGFFRTADRVEAVAGGRFAFLGRADEIVKVGGKRVDLAEIQERIRRIDGVRDAHVLALPRAGARQLQIAALVATARPAAEIRAELRQMPIPYGRPRTLRTVEAIPRLASGKIDREAVALLLAGGPPGTAET